MYVTKKVVEHIEVIPCIRFVAGEGVARLGIVFYITPPKLNGRALVIKKISLDSWAHKEGLRVGDEVLDLNGAAPDEMTEKDFKEKMAERPLTIAVLERVDGEAAAEEEVLEPQEV